MVMRIAFCAVVVVAIGLAKASDPLENAGMRVALKVFEDCSKSDSLSPCLKKKAITFVDRLSRMEKFSVSDYFTVVKAEDAPAPEPALTEEQIDSTLPRALEAKDSALTNMLLDRLGSFISSRSIQVELPRKGDIGEFGGFEGGKGGGRGKKNKGGNMMGHMMMGMAGKIATLIPVAIAGLFLLAGKALITAKIALLIAGIIAIKKLVASKQGGGGHGGWSSGGGGGGGGWQSSGGGGWDKRSLDNTDAAQKLAYSSYAPKQ